MPTLDFKGKSFIYTHHLGVPYRELLVVPEKSCTAADHTPDLEDNLIIHGDNLEALKALLPRYAGKVDCIYIDPPYNTGTEGWCYNDAVNAPLMREWLKKSANPVERDDLQRHDKWLCMMWSRLQLLKELLCENGVLLVSIDDNEHSSLCVILAEIFGEEGFLSTFIWRRRIGSSMSADWVSADHEYVLAFSRNPREVDVKGVERDMEKYSISDGKGRFYASMPLTVGMTKEMRPNQWYELKNPKTGTGYWPPDGRVWGYYPPTMAKKIADKAIIWPEDYPNRKMTTPRLKTFPEDAKRERKPVSTWICENGNASGTDEPIGLTTGKTEEGTRLLRQIFGKAPFAFNYPKPLSLVVGLLEQFTGPTSIILDSFAGSGTTAHAVLALNAKDGGNRRFILCEMEAYADTLTAERVRRVIQGYDYQGTSETELHPPEKVTWTTFKKAQVWLDRIEGIENLESANYEKIEKKIDDGVLTIVGKRTVKMQMPGLGGSFTYVELGEAMDLERLLAEKPGTLPSFGALARYLFFTATGHTLPSAPASKSTAAPKRPAKQGASPDLPADPIFIGETAVWRIYLHYRPDEAWLRSPAAAFTRTQAEAVAVARDKDASGKQVLVFAAAKYISHRSLRELHVDFAQLPYALHRVQSE
jgi:adenine-specific DNA-methyltransferase